MSDALLNIVIGLVTSVISGGSVWLWQHGHNARALRRKAAFFGLQQGKQCLIFTGNKYDSPGSADYQEVHALIDVATLAHEIGAKITLESCDLFRGSNGDRTEFCIGGPLGPNPRTAGHLAAHLPGVEIKPWDRDRADTLTIVVGGQAFPWNRRQEEYALIAKFTPPEASRPVFVIFGQTATGTRAAIHFIKREHHNLSQTLTSDDRFCIIVRVKGILTYGHQATELASNVSEAAFASPPQTSTAPEGRQPRA
ncbi:hypothetical protein GCM10009733_026320 [Nonomuraea maheshkhaliensis]|uniref:Uncharacterized protein n=1 Tax=Nonomuraea maheshkhaliensis TaxID=419590 RepID=A0ABN2F3N5_9ACTN